jgi:hypothetical protein
VTIRAAILRAAFLVAILTATPARAWDDASGSLDLPWLGSGERARLYAKKTSCLMCTTGYEYHQSWGRSGRGGSDPYSDVQRAFGFLQKRGILDTWPEAIGEGSVGDGKEIIEPRAAPYRFTIVMLEPTVVVMRFDLGALVKVGDFDSAQSFGTPRLNQGVEFGTKIPATGTLLWFSPQADQLPTPVALTSPEHGEIVVQGRRLTLDRRGDGWVVGPPRPAEPTTR